MAAAPSLSEKPATTTTKEPQSIGDSHPAVSPRVETLVNEVVAWQKRRIPNKYQLEERESRVAKLLYRDKAGIRGSQLSHSEAALVNSVPGVPLHGCSAKSSCSNRVDQLEIGRSKVRKKPATGSSSSSRGSRRGRKKVKNNCE